MGIQMAVQAAEESAKRSRRESDYLVFKKTKIGDIVVEPGTTYPTDDMEIEVYVLIGTRNAHSRKEAIRAQAKDDDANGTIYASVAAVDFTEHAPTKRVEWD